MVEQQLQARLVAALDAERRRGFDGLAGSEVDVVVPLRQAAIDEILAAARWPAPLETLTVRVAPGNVLLVTADVRIFGFVTSWPLRVRVAPSLEGGILQLALDDASLAARAVAWLGPLLARLPAGVRFQGARIEVDARRLAEDQGAADLLSMVTFGSCSTEEGVVWVSARVAPPATAPPGNARALPSSAPAFSPNQLVRWLAGGHLQGVIRIDERLANEVLGAAHAGVREAAVDDPMQAALIDAITDAPSVRFEAGALVVRARAVVGTDAYASTGPSFDETPEPTPRDAPHGAR